MTVQTRKSLENAIRNGGTVLLPGGVLTRSIDDLPSSAELKKMHVDPPKDFLVSPEGNPERNIGDPTGHPDWHDPANDSEEFDAENHPEPPKGKVRTQGTPTVENDPDNPPPASGPIAGREDQTVVPHKP